MKTLSNIALVDQLKNLVGEERKITALILDYLAEVQVRKLYLEYGFPNLFEFCLKFLGYSESAAYRRLGAVRLIKSIPEVREKIVSGELSLSVVAKTQSFITSQEKVIPVSQSQKVELLKNMENKSSKACERILLEFSPETVKADKIRAITPELTELRLTVEKEFMDLLEDLKNLYSHSHPHISIKELLRMGLELLRSKKDPGGVSRKTTGHAKNISSTQETQVRHIPATLINETEKVGLTSASDIENIYPASGSDIKRSDATPMAELKNSRSIPAKVRRAVWVRDHGSCQFKSSVTGQVCGSKKFLEIDHVLAFSLGGGAEIDNLQLLCDQHNRKKSNKDHYDFRSN